MTTDISKEILIDVGDDLSADLERDFQSGFIIVGPRTFGDLVLKDGNNRGQTTVF